MQEVVIASAARTAIGTFGCALKDVPDDPRIDASNISVDVGQQIVKLSGTVEDRRTKYAAEDIAELCGAREVENRLKVR